MSAKPKTQSTEIDHFRDTLTGVVNVVGETRQDIKKLDRKIEAYQQENRERFDQIDARFVQQDKRIAGLEADNAEIKDMLKTLLSR